jgi:hypothetical protein
MQREWTEGRDPQWDFILEIASKLWYDGEYSFAVNANVQQELVDAHWAALQAGRLLGVHAKVRVRGPSRAEPLTMVTVTFTDPDGRSRKRASDGFARLLNSVRHEHPPRR